MCGSDPAPHDDRISPMYALSQPPRKMYNPLEKTVEGAGLYGLRKSYAANDNAAPQSYGRGIDVLSLAVMHAAYRPKKDSGMMYDLGISPGLQYAYDKAARETVKSYRT